MIFNQLIELPNSYELCSWRSDGSKWSVGVRQMLYGRRVFCYKIGDDSYAVDYCTGDDLAMTAIVLLTVMRALYAVDESISPGQLRKLFPVENARPIFPNDLECWYELLEMAETAPDDLVVPDLINLRELLIEGVERARRTFLKDRESVEIAHD